MGGRRDYYGGVYDPETGQFTGGLEQKFYGEADRFDADYIRQAGRAEELTAEGARLATDRGFYEGLQADTQASQKALRDYRGRLDTMRDEVGREPTARGIRFRFTCRGYRQSSFWSEATAQPNACRAWHITNIPSCYSDDERDRRQCREMKRQAKGTL